MFSKMVILIPVYNPRERIINYVKKLKEKNYDVVVINDGSDENYHAVFERMVYDCKIINYPHFKGKGYALKKGYQYVKEHLKDKKGILILENEYDLNLIKLTEILEQEWGGKWKLVIRLHPRLLEKSNTFIQYNEKIIDGTKIEDIQELLAITDLLITDYSSIALDYMITRNPVIIYASDIDEYKKDRDFHLKLEDTPFPVAISQKELEKIIKEFNLQTYQYKLNDFINEFKFFDDGTASQKIVKLICKLIEDK